MRHKIILLLLTFNFLLTACVSIKLSDSWNSDNFDASKSKKLVVIARSEDESIRKDYEESLVLKLSNKDVDAVSALSEFPELKEKKTLSESEKNMILEKFKNSGIETIMLVALKDSKKTYVDNEINNSTDQMIYNRGRYGLSFVDYYNVHSIEYLSKDVMRNRPEQTVKPVEGNYYTTYIIEAIVYDITLKEQDQLVARFEVVAKEPESGEQVLSKFTNLISKKY